MHAIPKFFSLKFQPKKWIMRCEHKWNFARFFLIYWNLITVCCVTHLFFNCVCVKMIDNYSWSIHFNVSRQNDPIQTVNNDILAGMICEIECSQTDWQTNAAYTTRDTQQSNRRVKRANNYRIHCGLRICRCIGIWRDAQPTHWRAFARFGFVIVTLRIHTHVYTANEWVQSQNTYRNMFSFVTIEVIRQKKLIAQLLSGNFLNSIKP